MPRGPSEKGRRIQRLPARSSAILIRFQAAWSSLSPDATSSDNASDSTSATVLTGWMWISARTDSGTSSRSGSFRRGTMTSVRPARWAASSFCLTPPMGRTLGRTGPPVSRLASAVTFAVGSSYPPIDMRRVSTWSRVDDFFEPFACALSSNHHAVRRRSVLYSVARFGQGILGSHRRARTLGRRAAFAGSVGVENELFVDITVLQ